MIADYTVIFALLTEFLPTAEDFRIFYLCSGVTVIEGLNLK